MFYVFFFLFCYFLFHCVVDLLILFLQCAAVFLLLVCIWPVYACKKRYKIGLKRYSEIYIATD